MRSSTDVVKYYMACIWQTETPAIQAVNSNYSNDNQALGSAFGFIFDSCEYYSQTLRTVISTIHREHKHTSVSNGKLTSCEYAIYNFDINSSFLSATYMRQ